MIGAVLFVVISAVGRGIADRADSNAGNGSAAERPQTLVNDETFKEYVAADHGFKLNFPGVPAVRRENLSVSGSDVPQTFYWREIRNRSEGYYAAVWDYRGLPFNEADVSPEVFLDRMIKSREGSELVSTTPAPLGGSAGLEAHYLVPLVGEGSDTPVRSKAYMRLTRKDMQMFAVWTVDAPYSGFQSAADSFQFTQ